MGREVLRIFELIRLRMRLLLRPRGSRLTVCGCRRYRFHRGPPPRHGERGIHQVRCPGDGVRRETAWSMGQLFDIQLDAGQPIPMAGLSLTPYACCHRLQRLPSRTLRGELGAVSCTRIATRAEVRGAAVLFLSIVEFRAGDERLARALTPDSTGVMPTSCQVRGRHDLEGERRERSFERTG